MLFILWRWVSQQGVCCSGCMCRTDMCHAGIMRPMEQSDIHTIEIALVIISKAERRLEMNFYSWNRDIVELVESLPSLQKLWVPFPESHKLCVFIPTCSPGMHDLEASGSEVQYSPQFHEFKAILNYLRLFQTAAPTRKDSTSSIKSNTKLPHVC